MGKNVTQPLHQGTGSKEAHALISRRDLGTSLAVQTEDKENEGHEHDAEFRQNDPKNQWLDSGYYGRGRARRRSKGV